MFIGDMMEPSLRSTVRQQARLAAILAMIAGYIDAFGYITYSTYLSFMSGNTTQTGFNLGEGHYKEALPTFIAIICFVMGVFLGTLLIHIGQTRRRILGVVAALQFFILAFTLLGLDASITNIAILSLGMGIMNTSLVRVGTQLVSLTFVTGTLNRIANHLALALMRAPLQDAQGPWDTHGRRATIYLGIWSSFLAGALLSGMATPHFGAWTLVLPICLLVVQIAFNPALKTKT